MTKVLAFLMTTPSAGLSIDPIHWWDLDDDTVWSDDGTAGGWALTDNGSMAVSSGGGPNGQDVANFGTGSGNYLDLSNRAWNEAQFSVAGWIYVTSLANTQGCWLINHRLSGASAEAYQVLLNTSGTDSHKISVWDDADTQINIAPTSPAISTATWYHYALTVDLTANSTSLYVNAGTPTTDTTTMTTPATGSMPFAIGTAAWNKGSGSFHLDGRAAMIGLWDGVLTAADVAYLYNSGNGRQFADL